LAAKEIVDQKERTFVQVQDLARRSIGVHHIPAPLHKHVAGQGFEE
jgi:hypothetical protein